MIALTKIAETGTTITLGWTAPPDAHVYVFYAGGKRVSNGTAFYTSGAKKGQPREQVQFGKTGEPYEVAALCRDASGVFRVELGTYPVVAPPPPPPSDRRGVWYLKYGNGELPTAHVADYDLVVISWGGAPAAGASSAKSLVYMSQVSCKPNTGWHYGVTLEEARQAGWVLNDAGGAELTNVVYPDSKVGDPGSSAYQQRWAQNVEALLRQWGVDGVFVDDVLWWITNMTRGPISAKYDTQGKWLNAVVSFFAYVGPYLRSRGFYVAANASGWYPGSTNYDLGGEDDLKLWQALAPYVDALNCEEYQWHSSGVSRLAGPAWNQRWHEWQRLPALCEARGIDFLGMVGAPETGKQDYSICSALLETDGSVRPGGDNLNPWRPLFDRLGSLGSATGPKRQNGSRWERPHQGGLVWVETTTGAAGIS